MPTIVTPNGRILGTGSNIPYVWNSVTSSPQIIVSTSTATTWNSTDNSGHVFGAFGSQPAYVLPPNGTPNYLGLPNGLTSGTALGTNDSGQAVGFASDASLHIPLIWDSSRAVSVLDGANANARFITNAGAIFGETLDSNTSIGAAYWATSSSSMQTVPGTTNGYVAFVNATTGLAGVNLKTSQGFVGNAVVVTTNPLAVHVLKGGAAKISGISDSGVIVGNLYADPTKQFQGKPVVWKTMNSDPIELGKLIQTPSAWTVSGVVGIQPNGTVVMNAHELSSSSAQSYFYVTPLP